MEGYDLDDGNDEEHVVLLAGVTFRIMMIGDFPEERNGT